MNKNIFKYLASLLYVFLLLPPFNYLIALFFNKSTIGVDSEGYAITIPHVGSVGLGIEGIVIAIVAALVCTQIGFFLGEKGDIKLLKIATAIIVALLLSSIILIFFNRTILEVGSIFIYIVFCGYVGINLTNQVLSEYFSRSRLMKYIIINLIVWLLATLSLETQPIVYQMFIGFAIAFVLAMFVFNRGLLETVYRKKMTEAGVVDKKVQTYNVKIIAAFSVVFIAIVVVKDQLAYWLGEGLKAIGMGILGSLFKPAVQVTETPHSSLGPSDVPVSVRPTDNTLENLNRTQLINTILFVVVCVIVAVVLFFIIRFLIKNGPRKIRAAIRNFGNVFKGLTKRTVHVNKTVAGEYKDEFERVDEESKSATSKKFKDLQNQKKIRKITDPTAKMRAFYAFFMNVLVKNNVPVKLSNTTTELQDKADLIYSTKERSEYVTEKYNRLRYADVVPAESDLSTVDEYLADMSKNSISLKEDNDGKSPRKKR